MLPLHACLGTLPAQRVPLSLAQLATRSAGPAGQWRSARDALDRALADFLVAHIACLVAAPLRVADDGVVRKVRVLGAIDYVQDRQRHEVWIACMVAPGQWEKLDPAHGGKVDVDTFLCRPRWRQFVLHGVRHAALEWLRSHARDDASRIDRERCNAIGAACLARVWPRVRSVARLWQRVPVKLLRQRIRDALALDPALLALARCARINGRRGAVTQQWISFVWQHRAALQRVQRETPNLLAASAVCWFRHGLDGLDPVARLRAILLATDIQPSAFSLLAQQGLRPFQRVVRHWPAAHAFDALVLALTLAARPNGAHALPARLCQATLDLFADADPPRSTRAALAALPLRFFALAQRHYDGLADAAAVRAFIDDEYGLVINALLDRKDLRPFSRHIGWSRLVALVRREQQRRRATVLRVDWVSAITVWHDGAVVATALTSTLALFDEAAAMHSCVQQYGADCRRGGVRIFGALRRARDGATRATIGLAQRDGGAWVPWDVRGVCNCPLGADWWRVARRLAAAYRHAAEQAVIEPTTPRSYCRAIFDP